MILKTVRPIFYPRIASDYFVFNNNLNATESFVFYDSYTSTAKLPTVFVYKLKDSNNNPFKLKLYKVEFNGDIGTRKDSPALPRTNGKISLSRFAAFEDAVPSVYLYFQGPIQYEMEWNSDYPQGVGYDTFTATLTPNAFPSDKKIIVKYSYTDRYIETDYSYSGDRVTITCNWNDEEFIRTESNFTGNDIQFSPPTESYLINGTIPTVYINNWVGSDYNPGGDNPDDPGGDEQWTAFAVGSHGTYDETTGYYVSLFDGTEVGVDGIDGDSRHCGWNVWVNWYGVYEWVGVSAWIPSSWISPSNKP